MLNRYDCDDSFSNTNLVSNVCGDCFEGYLGRDLNDNSLCFEANSTTNGPIYEDEMASNCSDGTKNGMETDIGFKNKILMIFYLFTKFICVFRLWRGILFTL